ncbi:TPA: hypothetical protein H1902_003104 [Salmonella enterica]|nr:hypothetical protein [Salmonella enterica]
MKNLLDTVTQAANSLLTALQLPDESAQANQILGEMSFSGERPHERTVCGVTWHPQPSG